MVNSQDKPITVGNPIEVDSACNYLRLRLANLPWLSHPYFIAKRFFKKDATTGKQYIYPETYAVPPGVEPLDDQQAAKYPYHRLTPDSDYSGMCFFMVGPGNVQFEKNDYNFLTYQVGIIFSVNLKLIDPVKLRQGLFTRELMRDARRVISESIPFVDFELQITSETDDLQQVYREFRLDELEQYNRAPLQCFRIDLNLTIEEECI